MYLTKYYPYSGSIEKVYDDSKKRKLDSYQKGVQIPYVVPHVLLSSIMEILRTLEYMVSSTSTGMELLMVEGQPLVMYSYYLEVQSVG
jgi:hypothetical protein